MAKRSYLGRMNTLIKIIRELPDTLNDEGIPVVAGSVVVAETLCQWNNVHGTEVLEALKLEQREPATITMRHFPGVTSDCLLYREDDVTPYEILSIDDVENRHKWFEIKVMRTEKAR